MTKERHNIWIPRGLSKEAKSELTKKLYDVVNKHTSPSKWRNSKKKKSTYGKNKK